MQHDFSQNIQMQITRINVWFSHWNKRVVSLWRRANARNVRPYYPYWQYTDLFIFRFVSLLCLRSTLVSLWRRANARNVRLYYPYWLLYTDLFIFRFVSSKGLGRSRASPRLFNIIFSEIDRTEASTVSSLRISSSLKMLDQNDTAIPVGTDIGPNQGQEL